MARLEKKAQKVNEQSLQEIWNYVKRPNLRLIGIPECDKENESKLENTLHDIIQENFPNLASPGNTDNTTKIFLNKSNPKAHNRQIHQG